MGLPVIFYKLCYQSVFHCVLDDTDNIFSNIVCSFFLSNISLGKTIWLWIHTGKGSIKAMSLSHLLSLKQRWRIKVDCSWLYILLYTLGSPSWAPGRLTEQTSAGRDLGHLWLISLMYLYLPNGPEGSDPSWNNTLCLPQQKGYFHFPLVATQVYRWGSPDLKLFHYLIEMTVDLSTVFFQEQHETIPAPFYRKCNNQFGSITKAYHSAPSCKSYSFLCVHHKRWNNIQISLSLEAKCVNPYF